MTIEFKKLRETLFIPLKNTSKITLELECTTKTKIIESFNHLIVYLTLNENEKDKVLKIEEEITNYFEGTFKHSILKKTNTGIYKLLKVKDKVCTVIKTKAGKEALYTSVKPQKKYKIKLSLDYVWNKNNKYGFTWTLKEMQLI